MTLVHPETGEILPELSPGEARELTDRIKFGVEAIWELIKQAYQGRAWAALGHSSWDDYCTREFGTARLRLPMEERREVVASLRDAGMSVRAIAAATGMSHMTVSNDLNSGVQNFTPEEDEDDEPIVGIDGKKYQRRQQPTAAPVEEFSPESKPKFGRMTHREVYAENLEQLGHRLRATIEAYPPVVVDQISAHAEEMRGWIKELEGVRSQLSTYINQLRAASPEV